MGCAAGLVEAVRECIPGKTLLTFDTDAGLPCCVEEWDVLGDKRKTLLRDLRKSQGGTPTDSTGEAFLR